MDICLVPFDMLSPPLKIGIGIFFVLSSKQYEYLKSHSQKLKKNSTKLVSLHFCFVFVVLYSLHYNSFWGTTVIPKTCRNIKNRNVNPTKTPFPLLYIPKKKNQDHLTPTQLHSNSTSTKLSLFLSNRNGPLSQQHAFKLIAGQNNNNNKSEPIRPVVPTQTQHRKIMKDNNERGCRKQCAASLCGWLWSIVMKAVFIRGVEVWEKVTRQLITVRHYQTKRQNQVSLKNLIKVCSQYRKWNELQPEALSTLK